MAHYGNIGWGGGGGGGGGGGDYLHQTPDGWPYLTHRVTRLLSVKSCQICTFGLQRSCSAPAFVQCSHLSFTWTFLGHRESATFYPNLSSKLITRLRWMLHRKLYLDLTDGTAYPGQDGSLGGVKYRAPCSDNYGAKKHLMDAGFFKPIL